MTTAPGAAGGNEDKPGTKPSSQANGDAHPKTAAKSAPKKKTATRKAAAASGGTPAAPGSEPKSPPKSGPPAAPEHPPTGDAPGDEHSGKGGGNAPPPGGNGGSGPQGTGGGLPWTRLGLYGLAGLLGGAIAAAAILIAGPGGPVRAPSGLAAGDREQVAEVRRRIDELGEQVSALRAAPKLPGGEAASGAVRDSLQQISEELVRLDTRLGQISGEAARTGARLEGRVEALETLTPDNLPELLARAAERETVDGLQQRVARLERDEITQDVRNAALSLAVANLTRATRTSQPFGNELRALAALEPGNEAVTALKPYAESGLPSVPTLANRFDKVADNVVKAHRKAHGRGVLERLWDSIAGLFRVRPVGEVEGEKAPALVARTERRLEEGELRLAVEQLDRLGEPEKAAAAEWLEAARARLRLDNLVSRVNSEVLTEIAEAQAERRARQQNSGTARPETPEPASPPAPEAAPEAEAPAPAAPESPARESVPDTNGSETPQAEGEADSGASER